nr:unnamed protein product [Spirometra erinaceieuropaei]
MLHRAYYKCHINSADLAMCDLNEAIETDPSCYLLFYNRACCQEILHERKAALQDYSTALLIAETMGYTNTLCQSKCLLNRGLLYLAEYGDADAAITDFRRALAYLKPPIRVRMSAPHVVPPLYFANQRCLLMHSIGLLNHILLNYKDAREVFDKALTDYPGNNDLLFALANLLLDIGSKNAKLYEQRELKEATALYLRVISTEPNYLAAHVGLAKCQQISGRLLDAWHTITKAISGAIPQKHPNTEFPSQLAAAYEARAAVNLQMRRISAAMCDINTTLDLIPQWPEALTNRGILHHLQGNLNAAQQDFLRALDLDPQGILSRLNYGILQLHTGRIEEAQDCLSINHLSRDFSYPELYLTRALCSVLLGRQEAALSDLKAADQILPTLSGTDGLKSWTLVHNVKAVVFGAINRWEEAEREYSKHLTATPLDAIVYQARADTRLKMWQNGLLPDYSAALHDYHAAILIAGGDLCDLQQTALNRKNAL